MSLQCKIISSVICAVLLLPVCLCAMGEPVGNYDYPQDASPAYLYSAGRVLPVQNNSSQRVDNSIGWGAARSEKGHFVPAEEATELKARVRELRRQLIANARESIADYVVSVNTFVNLNNLYKTSSLGRYISEQLIGELQLAGIEVIDVRKSAGLMIHERHGEYGLSREMKELSYIHATQAMVVGTYTYANGQLFVNVRLLRNTDGLVLSNGSLVFDLDPVSGRMLADESIPAHRGGLVKIEKFENSLEE